MTFDQFLSSFSDSSWWQKHTSVCFVSDVYPLLFFSMLNGWLSREAIAPRAERVTVDEKDFTSLEAVLYQSFLGQQSWYWLGDISAISARKREQLLSMCVTYNGPHHVLLYAPDKNSDVFKRPHERCAVVHLPDKINKKQAHTLMRQWGGASYEKKQVDSLFAVHMTHAIDSVLRVMQYATFVSPRMYESFEASYLPQLVEHDTSLFSLSQYFFARKAKEFFALWKSCHDRYPELFWVSFWSDQLWRAYHVTLFMGHKNIAEARRMSARLPFIFPKQLWHHYTTKELAAMHERMYYIDHALKTGSSACHLDMFYAHHFGKKFIR